MGTGIETNAYLTQLTEEFLNTLNLEIKDDLFDAINNIEYIKGLISPDRKYAKDMPRDSLGRIIVDIVNPHILTDMDYFREAAIHFNTHGTYTHLRPNANPNSEFGVWIREEIDRIWYGMVRPSDGEWITGDMYFYLNYTPIIQSKIKKGTKIADRIVDFPAVWEGVYLWFHYIHLARHGGIYNNFEGGNHCVEIAKRGASKAHPYSQCIYTPNGLKKWGELQIGDKIFSSSGKETTIIDIPFDDEDDIYELTLADGRKVQSTLDHIWNISIKGREESLTLREIKSKYKLIRKVTDRNPKGVEYTCSIPNVNEGVEYPEAALTIEPYTMGLILGDGTLRNKLYNSVYYTSSIEDMETYRKLSPYQIDKMLSAASYFIRIPRALEYLTLFGLNNLLSQDKFIPKEYKYSSKDLRLKILAGLLDSDGHVDNKGIPTFTSVSVKLAEDVAFICRSLGFNCKITVNPAGYKKDGVYIPCLDAYTVRIYTDLLIFGLDRKNEKIKPRVTKYQRSKLDRTTIIDIKYSHRELAKCITVACESESYLVGDFIQTHNSYTCASMLARLFVVGDNPETKKEVIAVITAYLKDSLTKDGTLNKFEKAIDFCAENTQFPSRRINSTLDKMFWKMGYEDADTRTKKGTLNEVIGITSKDNVDKARGKRCSKFIYEEFGAFPKFIDTWTVNKRSVLEGDYIFGTAIAIGTGGSEGSNFYGALEMIYNPVGYNVYAIPNVFDKNSQGKLNTVFFFGAYMNRLGYYNNDGVSDVTGALIEIFKERYKIKYNTSDPLQLTRTKAEDPITIQEAIMKRESTIYPVSELTDRVNELDVDPKSLDDIYVGKLELTNGEVAYKPSYDVNPVRDFPHKDNKLAGAVEIHKLPEIDSKGKVYNNRYIGGIDPYDDDQSNTLSLGSIYILDLWTDKIVCEYTGRPMFADDFYEICRKMLIFYNARANYENNKKGLFKYFSQYNSLYLLTDTLDFLKDKDSTKGESLFGNKAKGTSSSAPTKAYARRCIRDWLLKPIVVFREVDGEVIEDTVPQLTTCKSRALMKELITWNPDGNFDRHDALGMVMLLREEKLRLLGNRNPETVDEEADKNYLGNDDFFTKNYKTNNAYYARKNRDAWMGKQ